MADDALKCMDEVFARMYEADVKGGRPSIAPEKLVRALLLQGCTQFVASACWWTDFLQDAVPLVRRPADGRDRVRPLDVQQDRDRLLENDVLVLLFNETVETARAGIFLGNTLASTAC